MSSTTLFRCLLYMQGKPQSHAQFQHPLTLPNPILVLLYLQSSLSILLPCFRLKSFKQFGHRMLHWHTVKLRYAYTLRFLLHSLIIVDGISRICRFSLLLIAITFSSSCWSALAPPLHCGHCIIFLANHQHSLLSFVQTFLPFKPPTIKSPILSIPRRPHPSPISSLSLHP